MVIVEGPDGSGKSTLVAALCNHFNTDIEERACTSDHGVDPRTLRDWVDRDMSRPVHQHGLYDRHPLISEPIYGPLIRGFMADGFNDVYWMMMALGMFQDLEPLVVFCLPPLEVVETNVMTTHDPSTIHLQGVITQCRALYDQYSYRAALAALSNLPTFIWDYTTMADDNDEWNTLLGMAEGKL